MHVLFERGAPLTLRDITTGVAQRTEERSIENIPAEVREEYSLELHHTHLPLIEDAGLITYDAERHMVVSVERDVLDELFPECPAP